ncbi:hypothetical protein ACFSKL_00505 [Belliella marina]|uniref:Uncharacterized protein n=1 Tax=Belliella marina TaxID=1644146 RepID=A0ABW4VGR4_9BACT
MQYFHPKSQHMDLGQIGFIAENNKTTIHPVSPAHNHLQMQQKKIPLQNYREGILSNSQTM